ncbi:MAG: VirB8/TrbF family protein [Acidobacteriota bacterium]
MSNYIYEKNAQKLINTVFKFIIVLQFLIIIIFSLYSFKLTAKINEIKPLPIFINKVTGEAEAVDFSFVDAEGETRCNAEINDFVIQFISDLYTFNRLTVKTNLVNALTKASPEGAVDIKNALMVSKRYDNINRNLQGLVSIKSISILNKLPDLNVQLYFNKKVVSGNGRIEINSNHFAIMRIKPVVRKKGNAHGLIIVEFRENLIKKGEVNEENNIDLY